MRLSKSDINVIYLAMRILDGALPYDEEIESISDKCKSVLTADEVLELDDEADRIMHETDALHELAHTILKK